MIPNGIVNSSSAYIWNEKEEMPSNFHESPSASLRTQQAADRAFSYSADLNDSYLEEEPNELFSGRLLDDPFTMESDHYNTDLFHFPYLGTPNYDAGFGDPFLEGGTWDSSDAESSNVTNNPHESLSFEELLDLSPLPGNVTMEIGAEENDNFKLEENGKVLEQRIQLQDERKEKHTKRVSKNQNLKYDAQPSNGELCKKDTQTI